MSQEKFIDQEVRIRLLETIAANIDHQFRVMNKRIDDKFKSQNKFFTVVITVIFVPLAMHYLGWV